MPLLSPACVVCVQSARGGSSEGGGKGGGSSKSLKDMSCVERMEAYIHKRKAKE
jgi:hypothetical protein